MSTEKRRGKSILNNPEDYTPKEEIERCLHCKLPDCRPQRCNNQSQNGYVGTHPCNAIPIIGVNLETGEKRCFASILAAEKELETSRGAIRRALSRNGNSKNWHWRYATDES